MGLGGAKWLVLFGGFVSFVIVSAATDLYAWECQGSGYAAKCVKLFSSPTTRGSFEKCRLTCGPYGSLFPRPSIAQHGSDVFYFHPDKIIQALHDCPPNVCARIRTAISLIIGNLANNAPGGKPPPHSIESIKKNELLLNVTVPSPNEILTLTTDESYTLDVSINPANPNVIWANVSAPTFFGARHGLETLSQLIDFDDETASYQIVNSASIIDAPAYPYRGVIIDTSRNFMSVKTLKKTIDAMSYHKLNSFHWHITDSASFPMFLSNLPNMTRYGAYSQKKVYSTEDMRGIVEYAMQRGIRVVPEFDAPAHVGHGWQWGKGSGLGDLIICLDKQPWDRYCASPPCGQLNIANPNIYKTLSQIYTEMISIFAPLELFHYGGDEVNIPCWNSSTEVVNWMTSSGFGLDEDAYYKRWGAFQKKAHQVFTEANQGIEIPAVVWTSHLTEKGRTSRFLDKSKYIIQIWSRNDNPLIQELIVNGFKVIFSNNDAFYFDCGVGSVVGSGLNWCEYSPWQKVYDNNFRKVIAKIGNTTDYQKSILGGEGAIWSESIDEYNLDMRLWPRGAALAERLWADPDTDYSYAEPRMLANRDRIVRMGVMADSLTPEWCAQNTGECRLPELPKPGE